MYKVVQYHCVLKKNLKNNDIIINKIILNPPAHCYCAQS